MVVLQEKKKTWNQEGISLSLSKKTWHKSDLNKPDVIVMVVTQVPSQTASPNPKIGARHFLPPKNTEGRMGVPTVVWPHMPWGFTHMATLCTGACKHDTIYYSFSFPVN